MSLSLFWIVFCCEKRWRPVKNPSKAAAMLLLYTQSYLHDPNDQWYARWISKKKSAQFALKMPHTSVSRITSMPNIAKDSFKHGSAQKTCVYFLRCLHNYPFWVEHLFYLAFAALKISCKQNFNSNKKAKMKNKKKKNGSQIMSNLEM